MWAREEKTFGGVNFFEIRRSFITTTVREESQVTPQVGFELETNGFQFYAIANLDKTSQILCGGKLRKA